MAFDARFRDTQRGGGFGGGSSSAAPSNDNGGGGVASVSAGVVVALLGLNGNLYLAEWLGCRRVA